MKKKNVFACGIFAVAMIVALTFTVCSEASDNSSGSVAVTGVTLNQNSLSLTVGNTAPLTATVLPSNASNKNVNWNSSNTGVATVNNGTVTAVAAGSATITVTTADGNKTATCAVTVTAQSDNNATPITVADITITGPSKNAVPVTTVGSEAERFTAGTVTWSPADNPFKGSTVYTATVTLMAKSGFTFQGLLDANVKVNGETATVSNNSGGTVTLSYTFAATNTKTISSIAIKTQPNNLTYTHGDKLDLSGLEITLTYDDATTEDVAASSFTAKNIATNPGHDTPLERSIYNGHPVTISIGGGTANTNNLTVNPGSASVFTIDAITAQTYTGNAITPTVTVKYPVADTVRTLTLTTDYTVAYSNNTNTGTNTATVTVTGIGDYTGTKEVTFTISPQNASALSIEAIMAQTYTGSALTPTVTVKDGTRTLTLTTDYTVAYSNNTNAGTATATITGTGNYTGNKSANFTINKANPTISTWPTATGITYGAALSTSVLSGGDTHGTFTWTNGTTIPTVTNSGYSVTFTPTDTANYNTATGTVSISVNPKNASALTIEAITDQTYTGSAITPTVTVKDGTRTLTLTTDYTVAYSNNTNAGTATATVTGIGDYTGNKSINFSIIIYALGDTGPGGGKIFYYSETGFTMTDSGETAHYLELAPYDITSVTWASSEYVNTDIEGTEVAVGTGRKNTALILAVDANAPAAKACADLNSGGKTDWFLPSKGEIEQLYNNRQYVNVNESYWYWTSSQDEASKAYAFSFYFGGSDKAWKSDNSVPLPVRAF